MLMSQKFRKMLAVNIPHVLILYEHAMLFLVELSFQGIHQYVQINPISHGGASEAPPSGIGDCSKTHLCIDLKLFDFSYISKTKILKQKKNSIFLPHPPSEGGTKKMKILKVGRRA